MSQPVGDLVIDLSLDAVRFDGCLRHPYPANIFDKAHRSMLSKQF